MDLIGLLLLLQIVRIYIARSPGDPREIISSNAE